MGGGPSRAEKEQEALLRQQQQQALQQQQQFFTQAAQVDPLAERLRTSRLNWFDATEGRKGPLDVTKLEGLGPALDLYRRAKERREGERFGTGLFSLGSANASPEFAARLKEQRDTEREQEAAGALENAFNIKNAEMTDSILPLVNQKAGKDLSLASLASGNANSARDAYLTMLLKPKKPPFWQSALMGGLGAVGGMFSGRYGGGD